MKNGRKGFNMAPPKGKTLVDLAVKKVHGIGTGWRTFSYKIKNAEDIFGEGMRCAVDKYMAYKLEEKGNGLFVDKICYIHRGHPIGSRNSVSSTKKAMDKWKEVIKYFSKKRRKNHTKCYPIVEYKIHTR